MSKMEFVTIYQIWITLIDRELTFLFLFIAGQRSEMPNKAMQQWYFSSDVRYISISMVRVTSDAKRSSKMMHRDEIA